MFKKTHRDEQRVSARLFFRQRQMLLKGRDMLYEVREGSDGSTYCFVSSDAEITQGDIDRSIAHMRAAGIWDWNIDDLCQTMEALGIEAVAVQTNGTLWI